MDNFEFVLEDDGTTPLCSLEQLFGADCKQGAEEIKVPVLNGLFIVQGTRKSIDAHKPGLSKVVHDAYQELHMAAFGEKMVIFSDDDYWIAGFKKSKNAGKMVLVCGVMITSQSPKKHFHDESTAPVPYLYNMMVHNLHIRQGLGTHLITIAKKYVASHPELYPLGCRINLDVGIGLPAYIREFYEKNGFIRVGKWDPHPKLAFYGYTYDNRVRQPNVTAS